MSEWIWLEDGEKISRIWKQNAIFLSEFVREKILGKVHDY